METNGNLKGIFQTSLNIKKNNLGIRFWIFWHTEFTQLASGKPTKNPEALTLYKFPKANKCESENQALEETFQKLDSFSGFSPYKTISTIITWLTNPPKKNTHPNVQVIFAGRVLLLQNLHLQVRCLEHVYNKNIIPNDGDLIAFTLVKKTVIKK